MDDSCKIHIGEIIKNKMEVEGKKVSWLAKNINCHRNSVYRIYNQEHLYSELLLKISVILQYNFFSHYCEHVREIITD